MSSALRCLVDRLRRESLCKPTRVFEEGRLRNDALASYANVASVFEALADDREHTYPMRDALSRALLHEHQASGEGLWASMLLVAYYPMLSRLRRRLVCENMPRDELDQVVVTAFLAVLPEIPKHADRIAMRLRQRTERQVFAFLRKEREQQHTNVDADELSNLGAEKPETCNTPLLEEALIDFQLLLERGAQEGIPRESLEVVEATVLRRELLRNYVQRLSSGDERERERMYQRLKRQRTRVLQKLRALLGQSLALLAIVF